MKLYILLIALIYSTPGPAGQIDASQEILARVNGAAVTRGEFDLVFGSRVTVGDSLAAAVEKTIELALDMKLKELAAVELGLLPDAGYGTFRALWLNENEGRKKAKESGQVFYGPTAFSERAFYDYHMSKLVAESTQKLFSNSPVCSDASIQAFYDSARQTLFSRPQEVHFLEVHSGEEKNDSLEALRADAGNINDPRLLMARHHCAAETLTASIHTYEELSPYLSKSLSSLGVNQVSEWYRDAQGMVLIKCLERREKGFIPLNEARGIICTRLAEAAYNDYIAVQRAKAQIEIDRNMVSRIIKELNNNLNR